MKTKWADRMKSPKYAALVMREAIALYVEETFQRDWSMKWRDQMVAEIRAVPLPSGLAPPKTKKKAKR